MRSILLTISTLLLVEAILATPIAVIMGIYDWAVLDMEFKVALWGAIKLWIGLLCVGLGVGFSMYMYAKH